MECLEPATHLHLGLFARIGKRPGAKTRFVRGFSPFFVNATTDVMRQPKPRPSSFDLHLLSGNTSKERVTAGSLPFDYAQGRNDKPEKQNQEHLS